MKRPLDTSIATLFHAPDGDGAPAGGTSAPPASAPQPSAAPAAPKASPAPKPRPGPPVSAKPAVEASASPTGKPIPKAERGAKPAPQVVQAKPSRMVDVKKALKLDMDPSKANALERDRIGKASQSATIIPTPKIKVSAADLEEEPAGDEPPIEQEPEPEPPQASAPTKLKIGDKEMTPEEIEAHIAALEAKANGTAEPAKQPDAKQPAAKKEPEKKLTPEEQQAEDQRLDSEYLDQRAKDFLPTEKEMDIILYGGEPAAKLFAQKLAQTELATRKWAEQTLNPIIEQLHSMAQPAFEMYQKVQAYQEEQDFYGNAAYADLKPHQAQVRRIDAIMRQKYPAEYGALTKEQRHKELAANVRSLIGEFGGQIAAQNNQQQQQAQPPKPKAARPLPPTGNVGATASPKTQDPQKTAVARLLAAGH